MKKPHCRIATLLLLSLTFSQIVAPPRTAIAAPQGGQAPGFAEAGVPAPDHPWTPEDYKQANEVFSKERTKLPLLADPAGAPIFDRIVSEESLEAFADKSVPLTTRMPNYLSLQDSANSILNLYLSAHNEGRIKAPTELARLMAYVLHLGSVGIALTAEFIPTIPHDANYEIRMMGIEKVRTGMTKMYAGLEQSLGERAVYAPEDLSVLLRSMRRELPVYKPMFEASYAAELSKKLQARLKDFDRKEDRESLQAMISELKGGAQRGV